MSNAQKSECQVNRDAILFATDLGDLRVMQADQIKIALCAEHLDGETDL